MKPNVKRYIALDCQIINNNKKAEKYEYGNNIDFIKADKWKQKAIAAMKKQAELSKILTKEEQQQIEEYYLCSDMF